MANFAKIKFTQTDWWKSIFVAWTEDLDLVFWVGNGKDKDGEEEQEKKDTAEA